MGMYVYVCVCVCACVCVCMCVCREEDSVRTQGGAKYMCMYMQILTHTRTCVQKDTVYYISTYTHTHYLCVGT